VDPSPEQLAAQARELDAEGIRLGETTAARELHARAAELRIQAIGLRIYPVLACSLCFRITGWADPSGRCDACVRRAQFHAAFTDPHGGLVSVRDSRPPRLPDRKPRRPFLSGLLARGQAQKRAVSHAWLTLVDPDETGPISPEAGYQTEVARRDQIGAADGSNTIVIRFTTSTSLFDGEAWERLETTRIRSSDILVPAELSAALPIEQLTEAWGDYGVAVHAINRAAWQQESNAREQQRVAALEREAAIEDQRNIAELLREQG